MLSNWPRIRASRASTSARASGSWIAIAAIPLVIASFHGHKGLIPILAASIAVVIALPWCYCSFTVDTTAPNALQTPGSVPIALSAYALVAAFAVFLCGWGVRLVSRALVNLGIVGFAVAVGWFYFSDIISKVNRSLGLIGRARWPEVGRSKTCAVDLKPSVGVSGRSWAVPLKPMEVRYEGRTSYVSWCMRAARCTNSIVPSVAAKYLYQRWRCPRVWTRAAAIDPELPLRDRYLSLQLTVDGC